MALLWVVSLSFVASLTGKVDRNLSSANHGDDKETNIFSVVFVHLPFKKNVLTFEF